MFISPHYYYPHDHKWVAPTPPLEDLAHQIGLLNHRDPLTAEDLAGSGADFPERYKPYVRHPDTIVTSPHKGVRDVDQRHDSAAASLPHREDRARETRRQSLRRSALRDFIEHGFEVAMVRDATAGAANEEGDGYHAALINWRFLAHAMWTTAETVKRIEGTMTAEQPDLVRCARGTSSE